MRPGVLGYERLQVLQDATWRWEERWSEEEGMVRKVKVRMEGKRGMNKARSGGGRKEGKKEGGEKVSTERWKRHTVKIGSYCSTTTCNYWDMSSLYCSVNNY